MINTLYEETESCVRVNGKRTKHFKIKQRVIQGDPLSQILFNMLEEKANLGTECK